MCINQIKTAIVSFTRKCKRDHLRAIRLNDMEVKQEAEIKYSTVTLDKNLFWKTEVANISRNTTRALLICRSIAGNKRKCTQMPISRAISRMF